MHCVMAYNFTINKSGVYFTTERYLGVLVPYFNRYGIVIF